MTTPTIEQDDDVDLALRHVTQLAARQRRMDRSLVVVADGQRRVEHVEWQLRWERDLPFRVYEYHALQSLALRESAAPKERVARVQSTVVLLSGREAPWPSHGVYRTSPKGARFSGVRFRIDAVYQRTLAELRARGSALWMMFAPLAVDASRDAMTDVINDLRARTARSRFEDLAVAMTVLADADVRRRGLRSVIAAQLPRELVMRSWIYRQGEESGLEQGREQGREQAAAALRAAIEKTCSLRKLRLTAALRAQLAAETRLDVLQSWLEGALTANRSADIFARPAA